MGIPAEAGIPLNETYVIPAYRGAHSPEPRMLVAMGIEIGYPVSGRIT